MTIPYIINLSRVQEQLLEHFPKLYVGDAVKE
jgi:hypothetical protein